MATAHPYGAFVGCGIKRIGCARRIKFNRRFYQTLSSQKKMPKKQIFSYISLLIRYWTITTTLGIFLFLRVT